MAAMAAAEDVLSLLAADEDSDEIDGFTIVSSTRGPHRSNAAQVEEEQHPVLDSMHCPRPDVIMVNPLQPDVARQRAWHCSMVSPSRLSNPSGQ